MNELVKPTLKVDLDINLPEIPPIQHNLGIIEDYAKNLKDFYGKLIFTSDQYKEATDERAKVNKLVKTMEDNRKETLKEYKKPIDDFEATSKRIESLLKEASALLSSKIEVFDLEQQKIKEQKINEKIEEIRKAFVNDFLEYGKPLNELVIEFDKRWFNKTYKDKDLEADIVAQFNEKIDDLNKFVKDAEHICMFYNTIDVEQVLNRDVYVEMYKHTRDVTEVINRIKADYEAKKKPIEKPKEEPSIIDPFAGLSINNPAIPQAEEVLYTIKLICNKEQLEKVKVFAKENGIGIEE